MSVDQVVRRIGPHLQVRSGLLKAADRAIEIGASAVQVFTDNPTAWRRRTELPPELAEFRARLAAADIGPLAVHAPYLVNLCGADEEFWQRSVATMVGELSVGAAFGARLVNLHIGSHRGLGREEGIRRLVLGLRQVVDEAGADLPAGAHQLPQLVLENSPGMGDGIGSTIEDLADIEEAAAGAGVPASAFGFCLDSAHLWAAGYRIDGAAGVDALIGRIDQVLGRERVVMIHLNDAKTACGSRRDRHEHIGAGMIGESGFAALLTHSWLAGLPSFLETPGMDAGYDAINLERVRLIARGEPLPALPAVASAVGKGRKRSARRVS